MPNEHPPIFKALAAKHTDRPKLTFEGDREAEFVNRMYWRGFVYGLLLSDKKVWNPRTTRR